MRKGKRRNQVRLNKLMFIMLYIAALIFLFVGGYYLHVGMDQHWRGRHNVDLGQNIRYLNAKYYLNLVDYYDHNDINKSMTGWSAVSLGFDQMETARDALIIGGLLVGFSIGMLGGLFDNLIGVIK